MARGSVTRRGESWLIAVELPPDPITGKRRQKWETVRGSKRDADKRLTELLALADRQLLGATSKMSLADFLARWLQDHASTRAPKTFARYSEIVGQQIVPHLGNVGLDKLTPGHLVRLQTILRDAPRKDGRPGPLSPQSLTHVHRVLHVALHCAVRWQLIAVNPADGVDAPRVPRSEMRSFTVEQARSFLAASEAEGIKWEAFFHLALTSGLRPGELCGLRCGMWSSTRARSACSRACSGSPAWDGSSASRRPRAAGAR